MSVRNSLASMLLAVAVLLFTLNLLGSVFGPFHRDAQSKAGSAGVPGYHYATRSTIELQSMLEKRRSKFDLELVNDVVFESLVHAADRRIQLHENWIMWMAGLVYEPASRIRRAQRIVSGGRAICSEAAAVLIEISKFNGVDARLVALNGHVVSEVYIDNSWRVADPDYGVVYSVDLSTLEAGGMSTTMEEKLRQKGFTDSTIAMYVKFFESAEDNSLFEIGQPSSPRLYVFENISEWLKWVIPGALMLAWFYLIRERRNSPSL